MANLKADRLGDNRDVDLQQVFGGLQGKESNYVLAPNEGKAPLTKVVSIYL